MTQTKFARAAAHAFAVTLTLAAGPALAQSTGAAIPAQSAGAAIPAQSTGAAVSAQSTGAAVSAQSAGAAATPAAPTVQQQAAQARARLSLPAPAVSALAVDLSRAVQGRLVACPSALGLPEAAVCLYAQGSADDLQARIQGRLGSQVLGGWQARGPLRWMLIRQASGESTYVGLLDLGGGEHLLILNSLGRSIPQGAQPGEWYVLDSDLIGVVKVEALGNGTFRLTPSGGEAVTVSPGQRAAAAQPGRTLSLSQAPLWDGKHLIVPVSMLRELGCSLSPTAGSLTVSCGQSSVGLLPIQF